MLYVCKCPHPGSLANQTFDRSVLQRAAAHKVATMLDVLRELCQHDLAGALVCWAEGFKSFFNSTLWLPFDLYHQLEQQTAAGPGPDSSVSVWSLCFVRKMAYLEGHSPEFYCFIALPSLCKSSCESNFHPRSAVVFSMLAYIFPPRFFGQALLKRLWTRMPPAGPFTVLCWMLAKLVIVCPVLLPLG